MPTVGTTAVQAFGPSNVPSSFVLHAAIANTGNISVSISDPTCVNAIEELSGGQSLSFDNFTGSVWVLGSASGQVYHIFGYQTGSAPIMK